MTIANDKQTWTTVLESRSRLLDFNLSELWRYKDLIMLLVRRDFVAGYKQTVLGPLWFILQPILSTLLYSVIFGLIARISTDETPRVLFYLSGIVLWSYFSTSLMKISDTFVANSHLFGKVYFPRLVVPISVVLTNFLTFLIQFGMYILFVIYYYMKNALIHPNLWILYTPVLLFQVAALSLGIGVLISSLTTKYRDLQFALNIGLQLWMYATPIVYPISFVPAKWQWLFIFNPMAPVVNAFRYAFLGSGSVDIQQLLVSFLITIVFLVLGISVFNKVQRNFMDTI